MNYNEWLKDLDLKDLVKEGLVKKLTLESW